MARRAVELHLSSLSIGELADLEQTAEGFVCEVTKVSTARLAVSIERRMAGAITGGWKAAAQNGLAKGVRQLAAGSYSASRIDAFLHGLGVKLREPLTKPQQEIVQARIGGIYKVSKQEAARQARGRFVFGEADELAIAASNSQQQFWVNGFYSAELSSRVSAVSRDVLIEQGLGHQEAGTTLMHALRQELGLSAAAGPSEFAAAVPARYAGNPAMYFEQVASVSGHQARIFGKVTGYDDCGVKTVELINPMDERTSPTCRQLNGQTFKVSAAMARMKAIRDAGTPDEVREEAPWLAPDQLSDALGETQPGTRAATEALMDTNMLLPPFHPHCRTEVVIRS